MPDPRHILPWLVLWVLLAFPAAAQEREKVESDLATTIEALKSASKEGKELEKRNAKLRKELAGLQQDLVSITTKVQRQEKLLSELEANLLNLQDEEREKATRLLRRKREQAQMVQTMLKLSRVPPEMVVAMPTDFETTMRTAKVLGLTTSALTQQAEVITVELGEIHALQNQIKHNHAQISRQKDTLQKNESQLQAKLGTREEIQTALLSQYEQQKSEVQRLSQQSGSLKELMTQLEDRHSQQAEKAAKLAVVPQDKPKPKSEKKQVPSQGKSPASAQFATTQGKIPLPAEGKIFIFYGDITEDGDTSRGISIRTRAAAKVTAPHAAEVVYTGTFLDYGNMVILRHDDSYHSLLAGMSTVSAKLGQQVIKGEPIGEMGRNEDKTALYMEIRKDNRPIDPMPWLDETQQYATKKQLHR